MGATVAKPSALRQAMSISFGPPPSAHIEGLFALAPPIQAVSSLEKFPSKSIGPSASM